MPNDSGHYLKMNDIRRIMEEELVRKGCISFERFMDLALYCPNFGYYEQFDVSPGQKGDFFTSVSVGSLFGELLACQFASWMDEIPSRERQLVEAGAHDGRLALDILRWLGNHRKDLLEGLKYWILEPSARRRQLQEKTLGEFARLVRWAESWGALPPVGIHGVIFSNELLDAMPLRRIGWDAKLKRWFEWGVKMGEGRFIWTRMPELGGGESSSFENEAHGATSKAVANLQPNVLEVLPDGFTTETCPVARDWWRSAASVLRAGRLLTVDYGLEAEEFFTPGRKQGTLRAYYKHHLENDVLARPGEQDITAQVNFSAIREAGEGAGLATEGFLTQAKFLTNIVEKALVVAPRFVESVSGRARQFQTLTHPEHLGQTFRALVQRR
jgi:SAM-dependent MidA family methyltransferase